MRGHGYQLKRKASPILARTQKSTLSTISPVESLDSRVRGNDMVRVIKAANRLPLVTPQSPHSPPPSFPRTRESRLSTSELPATVAFSCSLCQSKTRSVPFAYLFSSLASSPGEYPQGEGVVGLARLSTVLCIKHPLPLRGTPPSKTPREKNNEHPPPRRLPGMSRHAQHLPETCWG